MHITSRKFWLVVAGLILFDFVILSQILFRPIRRTDPSQWDFRIAELRQLESEGRYSQVTTSRPAGQALHGPLTKNWLTRYFPGQGVANTTNWYRVLPTPPQATSVADSHGQVL